jgi:uncharacterized protein YdhG (YjbR/CyaY superfamily)
MDAECLRGFQVDGRPDAIRLDVLVGSKGEILAASKSIQHCPRSRTSDLIRKAVPHAEEEISYKMPAYKLRGVPVIYFAGWKPYSLYPATDFVVAALKDDLAAYEVKKGTIRFSLSKPVPVKLIERIAKSRDKEAAGRDKSKAAGSKKS